jgi:hypothetical protein
MATSRVQRGARSGTAERLLGPSSGRPEPLRRCQTRQLRRQRADHSSVSICEVVLSGQAMAVASTSGLP